MAICQAAPKTKTSRVPIIGHEAKLGEAQHAHHHHVQGLHEHVHHLENQHEV